MRSDYSVALFETNFVGRAKIYKSNCVYMFLNINFLFTDPVLICYCILLYCSTTRSYKYCTQQARNICEARQIKYEIQAQIQYALLLITTKI